MPHANNEKADAPGRVWDLLVRLAKITGKLGERLRGKLLLGAPRDRCLAIQVAWAMGVGCAHRSILAPLKAIVYDPARGF